MPTGATLELRPHDPVTAEVLYCGLPDWAEMSFLLSFLRADDTFIDVGANVGTYTLLGAGIEGVRVVAFEPDHHARAQARANLARNGWTDRADLRPEAVADQLGRGRVTAGRGPMNRLVQGDPGGSAPVHDVEMTTLDYLLGAGTIDERVALVKVDVEGGEVAALRGGETLLRRGRPALILEANDPPGLEGVLRPLGYQWVSYDPISNRLSTAPSPQPGTNGIALGDLGAATDRLSVPSRAASPDCAG